MKYAKLIDGAISHAPNPILHNGMIRYNPNRGRDCAGMDVARGRRRG